MNRHIIFQSIFLDSIRSNLWGDLYYLAAVRNGNYCSILIERSIISEQTHTLQTPG